MRPAVLMRARFAGHNRHAMAGRSLYFGGCAVQAKYLHLVLQEEHLDLPAATLMVDSVIQYCKEKVGALGGGGDGWQMVWGRFGEGLGKVFFFGLRVGFARPQRRPVPES